MKIGEHCWTYIKIVEHQWKSGKFHEKYMNIYETIHAKWWDSMNNDEHRREIYENRWTSMKIHEESMKIAEKRWTSVNNLWKLIKCNRKSLKHPWQFVKTEKTRWKSTKSEDKYMENYEIEEHLWQLMRHRWKSKEFNE